MNPTPQSAAAPSSVRLAPGTTMNLRFVPERTQRRRRRTADAPHRSAGRLEEMEPVVEQQLGSHPARAQKSVFLSALKGRSIHGGIR